MTQIAVKLPPKIDDWTKSETTRRVDSKNIFDYMNGGGELYLAYGFDHLDVYHYESHKKSKILVEIYQMNTSDDAFGLLSLDWGGEPVTFTPLPNKKKESENPQTHRALYGSGLLRIWSGTVYARIMAYRETPEAKKAVISIGKAIAGDGSRAAPPDALKAFPGRVAKDWKLRNDRVGYFRSNLVLNSLYFLSYNNILDLDLATEAVTAPYENESNPGKRIQALLIKYPSKIKANKAAVHFHKVYLAEQAKPLEKSQTNTYNIEDGFLGYRVKGNCLTIIFEAPDPHTAQAITETISCDGIK